MHMLTIARTKDFPFLEVLEEALTYDDCNEQIIGKWEQVYINKEQFIAENIDEIKKLLEENDSNFDDSVSAYMDLYQMKEGADKAIYRRVSAVFDYLCLGGEFATEGFPLITQYKNVIELNKEIGTFITSDFSVHYADEEECPFAADDMVYIIDAHM